MDPSDTLGIVEHHLEITQLVTAIMVAEREHLEQIDDDTVRQQMLASYDVTMTALRNALQCAEHGIAGLQVHQKVPST